jgi:dihydrodipicolinate synthase/N-acetylneuraminate lyase
MLDLSGVIPPLCTPRDAAGGVDRASLVRLCHRLLDAAGLG